MKNIEKLNVSFPLDKSNVRKKIGFLTTIVQDNFTRLFKDFSKGELLLGLPNGEHLFLKGSEEGRHAKITFKSWSGVLKNFLGGELAFAESYVSGDIQVPNLSDLFYWYLENEVELNAKKKPSSITQVFNKFKHLVLNNNTKSGSKRNISFHYDLGNDFYGKWLDETMTYSSGDYSKTDDPVNAQKTKYKNMTRIAEIQEQSKVLEIGCGWGGFADYILSKHNVNYKGVTISKEQLEFGQNRLNNKGYSENQLLFEDYRDIRGKFDCIVSIEMFEAVGEKHWETYFNSIKKLLKPNGKAAIQTITIEHERFLTYKNQVDFIQKYIFPGGMLPSTEVFREHAEKADLKVIEQYNFGKSYAETLRFWRKNFNENWEEIKLLGFDDRFKRMWNYYLDYCEAGFEVGTINVVQFGLSHSGK